MYQISEKKFDRLMEILKHIQKMMNERRLWLRMVMLTDQDLDELNEALLDVQTEQIQQRKVN
jgi:hypothetical protein